MARNGQEALRLAADEALVVDLLITDVVMPELGGRDVAERLRARRPDLQVLYISGYTDDAVLQHGVGAGTDAFLQKPFSPVDLVNKVHILLGDARLDRKIGPASASGL